MIEFKLNGFQYRAYNTGDGDIIVEGKDGDKWHKTGSLRVVLEAQRLMAVTSPDPHYIEGNTP